MTIRDDERKRRAVGRGGCVCVLQDSGGVAEGGGVSEEEGGRGGVM